jgi:hypothetical protein
MRHYTIGAIEHLKNSRRFRDLRGVLLLVNRTMIRCGMGSFKFVV